MGWKNGKLPPAVVRDIANTDGTCVGPYGRAIRTFESARRDFRGIPAGGFGNPDNESNTHRD